ncbi:MAG: hypothetical protein A2905_01715 [Candidatus Levybacteria bacterium RIFCSPLOWO2_01_FULL_36_10]|nr:MAG: hypothetical protein A2905_01715 [Candidatus Levybacteria bacterium RIFCSPLOWO2_01_FULL_36_10]
MLSILVLFHEFGHFFVAKKFGIKVEEFGFGFPPRLFGIKKGETIYSINAFPFGGFVKLYGEDEAGSGKVDFKNSKKASNITDIKRAFFARPAWQRVLVTVAGVVMNFLLAVIIISYLFAVFGSIAPKDVKIDGIQKDTPAASSDIKPGDIVIAVNGKNIQTTQQFIDIANDNLDKKITLKIKRQDRLFNVPIVPRKNHPKNQGPMGVVITQEVEVKKYAWYEAPIKGLTEAVSFSYLMVKEMGRILIGFLFLGAKPEGVGGPVAVAQISFQAFSAGIYPTLWLIAILSLNLAIVNILPIPALDGGRLFFVAVEMVLGKKINPRHESLAHTVGLALLFGLIILITINDILRILAGKSLVSP